MVDLSKLNDGQKEAVTHTGGNLVVLSVSGSGKTTTLIKKIEYMVNELNYSASKIWACTFTNKAADEMRERLAITLGDEAEKVKISTVHSMAYKILKYLKQRQNPTWQAPRIMVNTYKVFFHLLSYVKNENFNNKNVGAYLQDIGWLKANLIDVNNFKKLRPYVEGHRMYNEDLHKVYIKYQEYLKYTRQMDFNDMLLLCNDALHDKKHEDSVKQLRKKIEHLVVDECQDLGVAAFSIVEALMGDNEVNSTMVGDLRQTIFCFQSANIQNMPDFIARHHPKVINLNINYRSTKSIVTAANNLIATAKDIENVPAITPNEQGYEVMYNTHEDSESEGSNILDLVESLIDDGLEYKDIFILYRIHAQAREIEDQFIINNIPYVIQSNANFYKRKEVKDILAYLEIITDVDNIDIKTLKRIANKPTRFLSNKVMELFDNQCFEKDYSTWEGLQNIYNMDGFKGWEMEALDNLSESLMTLNDMYNVDDCRTFELVKYILKDMKYEEWTIKEMQEKSPDQDPVLNLDALLTSVSKFPDAKAFLAFVNNSIEDEKKKKSKDGNHVKLMTVHASKGQEAHTVILLGVCNRMYPFYKAMESGGDGEEEKRIMYVAQTRAMKQMYFSVINGKMGRFNVGPSPYLDLMDIGYNGGNSVG